MTVTEIIGKKTIEDVTSKEKGVSMNLKTLTDMEILSQIKSTVSEEKNITLKVLHLLKEVENRRLYLSQGYASLFEYCVRELKYSEGATNRRVSSMRLLKQLPEIENKIIENKINLSTLSQLQSHIRREEKVCSSKLSKVQKLDLLSRIEGKSQSQCQRELMKNSSLPMEAFVSQRPRIVGPDLTEIKFLASNDLMNKFESLKNLLAHKNPNPTWSELIEILANMTLEKLDLKDTTAAAAKHCVKGSRYIPKWLKIKIWKRDQGECQFENRGTKIKCRSKHALEIDHIQPFALGGETSEENLRLLCRNHNQFQAQEIFGILNPRPI